MKAGFLCPDGVAVTSRSCLDKCRLGSRCLPRPLLSMMAEERAWTGKPSVTQLLKPTRMAYLEITHPYYVSPQDMAWLVIGSQSHLRLEGAAGAGALVEWEFELYGITGHVDLYEDGVLWDYKVWGSYAVGNGEQSDATLQLNYYRLGLQAAGHPVREMRLCVFVRDGNTESARLRGITANILTMSVGKMDDDAVIEFFMDRAYRLHEALRTGNPPLCTREERWDNRRCERYCHGWRHCEYGTMLRKATKFQTQQQTQRR